MIKNYALFYSYKALGDVLFVTFNNSNKPNKEVKTKNVVSLYNNEELVGYNIYNISKIIKIKTVGIIYFPSEMMINIINSILSNAKLETLAYKEKSGYFIGKVIDILKRNEGYKVKVDISNEILTCLTKKEVNINDVICVATCGTALYNGNVVTNETIDGDIVNSHICNNIELGISDDENILILEKDETIGNDFFQMEVK